jgi:hypothetical protein
MCWADVYMVKQGEYLLDRLREKGRKLIVKGTLKPKICMRLELMFGESLIRVISKYFWRIVIHTKF